MSCITLMATTTTTSSKWSVGKGGGVVASEAVILQRRRHSCSRAKGGWETRAAWSVAAASLMRGLLRGQHRNATVSELLKGTSQSRLRLRKRGAFTKAAAKKRARPSTADGQVRLRLVSCVAYQSDRPHEWAWVPMVVGPALLCYALLSSLHPDWGFHPGSISGQWNWVPILFSICSCDQSHCECNPSISRLSLPVTSPPLCSVLGLLPCTVPGRQPWSTDWYAASAAMVIL